MCTVRPGAGVVGFGVVVVGSGVVVVGLGVVVVGLGVVVVGSEVLLVVLGAVVVGSVVEGAGGSVLLGAVVEGAVVEGSVVEGSVVEGSVVEGAGTGGSVVLGAVVDGSVVLVAVREGAVDDCSVVLGAVVEGSVVEGVVSVGSGVLVSVRLDGSVVELDGVLPSVLEGSVLEGSVLEGSVLEGSVLEGSVLVDSVVVRSVGMIGSFPGGSSGISRCGGRLGIGMPVLVRWRWARCGQAETGPVTVTVTAPGSLAAVCSALDVGGPETVGGAAYRSTPCELCAADRPAIEPATASTVTMPATATAGPNRAVRSAARWCVCSLRCRPMSVTVATHFRRSGRVRRAA